MLVLEGVYKYFSSSGTNRLVLENINLRVKSGEFVCLVGPSGCGKSTLLSIIAGLEKADRGRVYKDGKEITAAGPDRVVMFQEAALFPWLKVIENVEYGLKIAGIPKEVRREKALRYLKMVHLSRFADSYPHQLSGGMRQRVALARALAVDSDVLLMDEPFAALDAQTRYLLHRELQEIWQVTGKTIVFVTHSVEEAVLLADRVVVMAAHPGRIKKQFAIQLSRPRHMKNVDLAFLAGEILRELEEEVAKVARAEYDGDWSPEEDVFLPAPNSNMGDGI